MTITLINLNGIITDFAASRNVSSSQQIQCLQCYNDGTKASRIAKMLKLRMHKAGNGDCISIVTESEFILIDGGTAQSFDNWKDQVIGQTSKLTKIIVTHIDNDHANGIIKLLEHAKCPEIESILFNGAEQLIGNLEIDNSTNPHIDRKLQALASEFSVSDNNTKIGYAEGTSLSYLLNSKNLKCNRIIGGQAIYREGLKSFEAGEIKFTIIGPEKSSLTEITENWESKLNEKRIKPKIINKAYYDAFETYISNIKDLAPTNKISNTALYTIESLANEPFVEDASATNRSSFSFLIEYRDKRILYLGDCHAETVISWLDSCGIDTIEVDAVKISHHGSKNNTSRTLLKRIDSPRYMISTNGKSHGHPNLETLARIAVENRSRKTTILVNYNLDNIPAWFTEQLKTKYPNITFEMDIYETEL
ncbi:ComEC/Rec2 family competence protein [Pseudomonas sp. xss_2]|uniref:ComEC/Rec2 family competence protein n=1 Tax=Pseudomonas sp. xss_2 TaxID=3367215 RepID=UPI00370BB5F9